MNWVYEREIFCVIISLYPFPKEVKVKRKKLQSINGDDNHGLDVEYYIDSETGDFKSIYTFNGEVVESVKLRGRLADRASALSLILRDLQSAKDWYLGALAILDAKGVKSTGLGYRGIQDLDVSSEVRALFVASVIFYGKAYSEAVGRRLKMERVWLDPSFFDNHDNIIDYRNNFAAHSGNLKYESAETSLLIFKQHGRTIFQPVTDRKQLSLFGLDENEGNITDLYDHAIEVVTKKYNETLIRIRKHVEDKSISYWYLAAGGTESVDLDTMNKKKK